MMPPEHSRSSLQRWLALALLVAICLGAAALGGVLTSHSVNDWYPTLKKPSWNPPNWVFAPVWTTLYLLMAAAAWLVWMNDTASRRLPMTLFGTQLLLNTAWSALFFGLRNPGLALIDVVLLFLAIAATIAAFRRVSSGAAVLLLPYLAWVAFAACLNAAIWRMNA
jgi:tryptophan-rich sensory protein